MPSVKTVEGKDIKVILEFINDNKTKNRIVSSSKKTKNVRKPESICSRFGFLRLVRERVTSL